MARAPFFAPSQLRGDILRGATIAHAMETGYRVDSAGCHRAARRHPPHRSAATKASYGSGGSTWWPAIWPTRWWLFHLRATTSGTISVT